MPPDAYQFRDIHAALGNPWWPPAPGWWLLLAALALLALALWRFDLIWRLRVPIPMVTLGNWRWDASRELRRLRRDAGSASAKQTASELSELLRRIAIARQGRDSCAGLHGRDWLSWLSAHDPKGFDWQAQGRLLLETPYAPPTTTEADRSALIVLIDAAMDWAIASETKPILTAAKEQADTNVDSAIFWLNARLARLHRAIRPNNTSAHRSTTVNGN
ncbi:MAG TPA: DUF4381 domain-containing protein [Chromatiaceae bacterium]|jgi:hypothetical protein|nr:MAG: hypothetical protein N838_17500 [Thiohalocapsa sp. PB-PSB1]QQO54512.1 MAG: DUF4381 domain-containing protein [Thiohalocapsa sp. PB-PSB1]HBG94123.1 DUF4381 domain-containing protein [Chromatiaceae bacterium]HCS92556.1 DUF4381 domain-containing protein [Chromatiaceae bacterium]